jgi:hypothetical protein
MTNAKPKSEPLPGTLEKLAGEFELTITDDEISTGKHYCFITTERHERVPPPKDLPSISGKYDSGELATFFIVPSDADLAWKGNDGTVRWDLGENMYRSAKLELLDFDNAVIPERSDWPSDDVVRDEIMKYKNQCRSEEGDDEVRSEIRSSEARLAGAAKIEGPTPMLIEGFVRDIGVSVIYGDMDEFKTTMAIDWAVHIAYGFPWQSRRVMPHPVMWYALEGIDEFPERIKATQSLLSDGQGSPWGKGDAPIRVFDRIPDDFDEWLDEVRATKDEFDELHDNRLWSKATPKSDIEKYKYIDGEGQPQFDEGAINHDCLRYGSEGAGKMVVVIDTLSLALGEDDEKGPKAQAFVHKCLDLLKRDPKAEEFSEWRYHAPVAHVIIIHHQTKTGTGYGGHRSIAANTSGLYHVTRVGKLNDEERSMAFSVRPERTKGMSRPQLMRLEAGIVSVPGTDRRTVIVKDKAEAVPKRLMPIIEALCELEEQQEITRNDLNSCLDIISKAKGNAQRAARSRNRGALEELGVLEPVEDDAGKIVRYRFHDPK